MINWLDKTLNRQDEISDSMAVIKNFKRAPSARIECLRKNDSINLLDLLVLRWEFQNIFKNTQLIEWYDVVE